MVQITTIWVEEMIIDLCQGVDFYFGDVDTFLFYGQPEFLIPLSNRQCFIAIWVSV
jgi:hypothetical protein